MNERGRGTKRNFEDFEERDAKIGMHDAHIYYRLKHRTPSEEQYLVNQLRNGRDYTEASGRMMLQYLVSLSPSQLIEEREYPVFEWKWEGDEYYHSDFGVFIGIKLKQLSDYELNKLAYKLITTEGEEYGEDYGVETPQQAFNLLKQLQRHYDPDEVDPTFFESEFKSDFHDYLLTS